MSEYHQIFAQAVVQERQLIADVALAAGTELPPAQNAVPATIAYAGEVDGAAVEVELSHDFEDDRGIPFSRYPVVITIRAYNGDKTREERLARGIFDKLCGRGSYSLLLVFGLQRLLGKCAP
ncbi:MAG: hypothetical protein ACM3ML_31735 [Micromonosporaceae bacterium]